MPTIVHKTIKAAGGDYASLALLEAANANLVALDEVWIVTADNLEETVGVNFNGWTTDSTRYLHVRAADRHGSLGRVTTNAFRLVVAANCLTVTGIGAGGFMIFEGIQLKCTNAANRCLSHPNNGTITAKVRYIGCVFESTGEGVHLDGGAAATNDIELINCVGICANPCFVREFRDCWIYSCTFITTAAGQHCVNFGANDGRTKIVKSSYAKPGAGGNAYNSVFTGTQAAASDATGNPAGVDNIAYSTANFVNVTAGTEDLSLPALSALLGIGADRSADAAQFQYVTDIRGFVRELNLDDIGAFERSALPVTDTEDDVALVIATFKETHRMRVTEIPPDALGLNQKNMKAAGNTEYDSGVLNWGDKTSFLVSYINAITGVPTVGAAKLSVVLLADDEVTVLGTVDLLTAIGTTVARQELVTFGRGISSSNVGNGTIGTDIDILKLIRKCKLRITVSTQADGTTVTGTVRAFAA